MKNLSFTIWPTYACNLKCDYCYEGEKKINNMDSKTALKTVHFIVDMCRKNNSKNCYVSFHGGEPFLNAVAIWEIIDQLNESALSTEFTYSITTNGYKITKEDQIKIIEKMDDITISIDGTNKYHDIHRKDLLGQGTFDRVWRTAMDLLEKRRDVCLRMTVTPQNLCGLYESIMFFVENGFENIRPIPDDFYYKWSNKNLNKFSVCMKQIQEYILKNGNPKLNIAFATKIHFASKASCDGGISSFHIDPIGNLYPCSVVVGNEEHLCGDILNGIAPEWENTMQEITASSNLECDDCDFRNYCSSFRCKFLNHNATGNYGSPTEMMCAIENIFFDLNK